MKTLIKQIFLVLFLLITTNSVNAACNSDCQLEQIKSYFKALDLISRKGSTEKDIDDFLNLVHDDVQYIHVEYEANFNKTTWREAFVRNLKRGAYNNSEHNQQRILKSIFGKNHIAIEYAHGEVQPDGSWKAEEPLLVLFGFSDDKITLVKELW